MARQVVFHELGGADVLRIEDHALRPPGQNEVRINVVAIGLNRAEVLFREGLYRAQPRLPSGLGYEASGIVDAIGGDVKNLQIGDRVSTIPAFSMADYGVYGDSAIVPEHAVARYPDTLSAVEGASIWMQYMTAYGALIEFGKLRQDDTVLITAASGNVGIAAIQVSRMAGAQVIVTTRNRRKKQRLLDAGAHHVVVTEDEDIVERVAAITADTGADIIFDPIAGPMLPELARAAANGGTIIVYGKLSTEPALYPLSEALAKGLVIRGYSLFETTLDPKRMADAKHFVCAGLEAGDLVPIVDRTFELENIVAAHRYMESNQQVGKIVVVSSRFGC